MAGTDANVDKKSFSFDLIPASLIANTVVVKTATPDLPGDFAGGLVQVNTLEFPSRRVLGVVYGPRTDAGRAGMAAALGRFAALLADHAGAGRTRTCILPPE